MNNQLKHSNLIKVLRIIKTEKGKIISLTPTEIDCLAFWINNYTAKQIAEKLVVSHRTIQTHLYRVTKKFGCKNRLEMYLFLKNLKKDILLNELFLCLKCSRNLLKLKSN